VKDLDAGTVQVLVILGGKSGVHSARRIGHAGSPEEGEAAGPAGAVRRRDQRGLPVAPPGDALPRNVGAMRGRSTAR